MFCFDLLSFVPYLFLFVTKHTHTGLIPESITKMTSLIELVLQDNKLDGFECIHNYGYSDCEFDMPSLQRLDVSDNRLDGSVPAQIFHLPELRSVALVNGCFDGHLTDDICLATNLEVCGSVIFTLVTLVLHIFFSFTGAVVRWPDIKSEMPQKHRQPVRVAKGLHCATLYERKHS